MAVAGTGLFLAGCSYDEKKIVLLTAQLKWEIMDISLV
jgi:hypothetical protein